MQKDKILELLSDFVAIESVSTDPSRKDQMDEAVQFLSEELTNMGFRVKLFQKGAAPPLIVASLIQSSKAKTLGIYGHYDVQPEDPVAEWSSPPFELKERNGKFFGRGVADDKGHVIQNLVAINHLIESESLKNNIVFLFEGEEESASNNFETYIKESQDLLKTVDVFYLLDAGMYAKHVPQIFYALRGIVYFEIMLEIGIRDLHSGIYGGYVYNPIQVLGNLFSKIKDERTGKILIPGFYNDVRSISDKERAVLTQIARGGEGQKQEAGVYETVSLDQKQPYLTSKIYPSFDINGVLSGYTGEGSKTVIPRQAMAKFSFRLVENQDPVEIDRLITLFIKNNLPGGVRYRLKKYEHSSPFYSDYQNTYVKKTAEIFNKVFGNETKFNRSGGSIPAAEVLQRLIKRPIIITGFTLPDDNLHAPNENFDEEMFFKGIEALEKIYGS